MRRPTITMTRFFLLCTASNTSKTLLLKNQFSCAIASPNNKSKRFRTYRFPVRILVKDTILNFKYKTKKLHIFKKN